LKKIAPTLFKILLSLLLCGVPFISASQERNKKDKPKEGNFLVTPSGREIKFEKIGRIENDSVFYSKAGNKLGVHIDSVSMLRTVEDKGRAVQGLLIGASIGLVFPVIDVALLEDDKYVDESKFIRKCAILFIAGALLGTLVGNAAENFKIENTDIERYGGREEKKKALMNSLTYKQSGDPDPVYDNKQ
jgi:hypothetical protein